MRTALVIAVPEAEPHIGALRLAHDPVAARGVPAHITVLFPFGDAIDDVAELAAEHAAFDFTLAEVRYFGDALTYLAPEPAAPFVALTKAAWTRWPAYPPYEGKHPDIVPHLTVAHARVPLAIAPIACRARELVWLEERADRWHLRRSFALTDRNAGGAPSR